MKAALAVGDVFFRNSLIKSVIADTVKLLPVPADPS